MLKKLQKYWGAAPDTSAQAEQQKEETMNENQSDAALADAPTTTEAPVDAALQATVESLTAQLAEATAKIAELTATVEAATEFKAAQEKAAKATKLAARKEKLAELVGTAAVASLMTATAEMDDAAFEAVASALAVKATAEANTPAFKEQGVEGEADAAQLATEGNGVMAALKAKWHQPDSN